MDLSLREGIHLQAVIHTTMGIDLNRKLCGFNQAGLGWLCDCEIGRGWGWGLDIIAELYT